MARSCPDANHRPTASESIKSLHSGRHWYRLRLLGGKVLRGNAHPCGAG